MRNYLFILLCPLFLSGCGASRDSAPPFYVDEKRIPNAVPKLEPLSRIGNKPVYHVFGKTYHVLPSSKGYEEEGVASWYGTKFHRQFTSNGERYDMLGMTAAHKSLPLPTYVHVTNLANGKSVIVRVNDRGPFESNRIIDLSYVAAKKLNIIGHGTARVRIRAITPGEIIPDLTLPTSNPPAHTMTQMIFIQVAAFKDKYNAIALSNKLRRYLTSPIFVTQGNDKTLFKVKIGPVHTLKMAESIKQKIRTIAHY